MSKGGRLSRLFPKLFRSDKDKTQSDGDLKGPVCLIMYLDDTERRVSFKNNWKGQVLFDLVCDQVNIFEKDYFGLRFVDTAGQTHWVDHGKSLSSQMKGCTSPHKFYFCVKFYAADPCKLKEEITRYLFFLQVKRDILQGRLPVTFDEAAELCAYAVQSELGDFDPRQNTLGYISEFSFVPNQTEELENRIAAMHRRCVGATPMMAEHKFLEKSKWMEMYGVDLHPVQGESNVEYFLGLTPTGIVVYKQKTKVASYFWPRVTKASHKTKIFMIKVKDKNNDEHVYAFELSSKSACKHLWKCCVEHHAFFRLTQAKDKESRPTKVLRSLSNSSHRGRSERKALSEQMGRQEPNVQRVTSRRQQRRVNSESRLNGDQSYGNTEGGLITLMGQPQPVRAPRHRSLPELQGKESPRSVKSAPWESKFDYGLYTSGHESPAERAHHGRHPRAISGSDSESGISQRKKYFPSRKESDNESDGSASRRRRREMDSDSGSEVSFTNSGQGKRHNTGKTKDHNRNDVPILYPFREKDKNKNGSIPSLHSAPVGEVKQQRRRRRRSKSPGNSKQLPEEIKQHLDFNLIDTEGMTHEQLQDITYTKVETKSNLFRVKYSPKFRQKIWASRRKSFGDADRQSDPTPKAGGTLGRQDSHNTDPAGTHGRHTNQGGSSVDERPPPYNSVRPASGNYSQSGYESRGSHISSSRYQKVPPSPYQVLTSPKKEQEKENNTGSDMDTLVSYTQSVRSYASRGAKSDVLHARRNPERNRQLSSCSAADIRRLPNGGYPRHSNDNKMNSGYSSSPQIEDRGRLMERRGVEQEYSDGNRRRNQSYANHPHHHHAESHHHFPVLPPPPSSSSVTSLPGGHAVDRSSYHHPLSPKQPSNYHHVSTTHSIYLSNPRRLPDNGNTDASRAPRPSNPSYGTVGINDRDHQKYQSPQTQQNSQANATHSSHPQNAYRNPLYYNNKGVSTPPQTVSSNGYNSKGVSTPPQTVSSNGYNSGNVSGSRPYQQPYDNQRQASSNLNNKNNNIRPNEYGHGRQTPSRNLYPDFQDAALSRSPGESTSSPSRHSVGVTTNSSQTRTPPRSHHPSYQHHTPPKSDYALHSQHHTPPKSDYALHSQQHTPPKSDYALHSQQHTPPKSQQPTHNQHTPPRSQQPTHNQHTPPRSQQPMYGQQQAPPRSQYSTPGQLRGGSSMRRGPGSDYRNPAPSNHDGNQTPGQYEFSPRTPPNYNPDPNHMRGHSGQSASSSGYSGSHSHQSMGTPSGYSPQKVWSGNANTHYSAQPSSGNPPYNQRQNFNNIDQRPPQGHHQPQGYSTTPLRVYRSDLVTEL